MPMQARKPDTAPIRWEEQSWEQLWRWPRNRLRHRFTVLMMLICSRNAQLCGFRGWSVDSDASGWLFPLDASKTLGRRPSSLSHSLSLSPSLSDLSEEAIYFPRAGTSARYLRYLSHEAVATAAYAVYLKIDCLPPRRCGCDGSWTSPTPHPLSLR